MSSQDQPRDQQDPGFQFRLAVSKRSIEWEFHLDLPPPLATVIISGLIWAVVDFIRSNL